MAAPGMFCASTLLRSRCSSRLRKHLRSRAVVQSNSLTGAFSGISGIRSMTAGGVKQSGTCGSMDLGANMQRHQSQRGRLLSKDSSKLHSFDFVSSQSCLSGEKERYGGKKCCRTLQPSPLLFFRHFQAIEQLSINWGAQAPPALLDPSKSI